MYTENIKIDGLGHLLYRQSKRAKKISISIYKNGDVCVTFPNKSTLKEAIKFTYFKKKWIQKNRLKSNKLGLKPLDPNINPDLLKLFQVSIFKRLQKSAQKYNFNYGRVVFKTMSSRWGSCSTSNNISLNNFLYYVGYDLQDYVIKHELMHTKIKNHSAFFWKELEAICENSKRKRFLINSSFLIRPKNKSINFD